MPDPSGASLPPRSRRVKHTRSRIAGKIRLLDLGRDKASFDPEDIGSIAAGARFRALDYVDGLVRVGVQSEIERPETSKLIRELMIERGLSVPPLNRTIDSICIVQICAPQP